MAIISGGKERLLLKYPDLDLDSVEFVGWGTGEYFQTYYPYIKDILKLKYLVSSDTGSHGRRLLGLDVKPTSQLFNESANKTVVVIFDPHFYDVMHTLRDHFGNMKCVRATGGDSDVPELKEAQDFWKIKEDLSFSWIFKKKPRFGIFVQGAVSAHTPYILAKHRLMYPDGYQCMVTWDNQNPKILEECEKWLDKLILTSPPENPGHLFINSILRSCRLGAKHLSEEGIEYAVRTRSDCLLSGSINGIIDKYFERNRNPGKIATVINGGWWHHLPFMFNEKAMVSRTQDMLNFWSMAEDSRPAEHPDFVIDAEKQHFMELSKVVPEVWLWKNYAASLNVPNNTLEDSYNFMREYVLPIEPHIKNVSLKFIPLYNVVADTSFHASLDTWQKLASSHENAIEHARSLDTLEMNVRSFYQRRIG